ncbi:hypothetical protein I3760_15G092400 [Carya illinoinensis]|nr:hypothetical protein I3760_15G092400 [Carya illinoinensis]
MHFYWFLSVFMLFSMSVSLVCFYFPNFLLVCSVFCWLVSFCCLTIRLRGCDAMMMTISPGVQTVFSVLCKPAFRQKLPCLNLAMEEKCAWAGESKRMWSLLESLWGTHACFCACLP